jgi:hypothetical protein
MKSLSVAAKIWAKTVVMNAFLWGVWSMLKGNIWEAFWSIAFLIVGFIITLPLLMFIVPLVSVSALLPYNVPAKTAWLTFYLIEMMILFYWLCSIVEADSFFKSHLWAGKFTGTTIGGLLIAVVTTRKSLNKFYKKT